MSKWQFAGSKRQNRSLVALSLLYLLLLGASVLWWSGGSTAGPAGVLLRGALHSTSSSASSKPALGFDVCERAVLDEEKLKDWNCKVFNKACFDHDNMVIHSGEKTPNSSNFSFDVLFQPVDVPAYVLPGYDEPLGTPHFTPKCWSINIRGPTPYDPADIWQPTEFTNCTVPLVWWTSYFSIFSDLFLNSATALDVMMQEGAYDRNVTLAPVSLGMDLPAFYQSLLEPYTRHKLVSLSAMSSREHIATGQPRCYERAVLCNMVGMYAATPNHYWQELRPKLAGRRAVEYFRRQYPDEFRLQDRLAREEKGAVFRVAFMPRSGGSRVIRNLQEVVQECKKWVPPDDTQYKTADCVLLPDGSAENHVKLLAQFQNVHALVNTHGSGDTYAFFMPNGTGLVEILAWDFHGQGCTWADQYFADWYELDHSVNSGYFRLVADKDHVFPGPYELANNGSSVAYTRDRDVTVDFPTLAKALTKIARGELHTTFENRDERTFFMTRKDLCPGHVEWLQKQQAAKERAEKEQEKGEGDKAQGEQEAPA